MPNDSRSRVEDVHQRLRLAILNGQLSPATQLKSVELCAAYGTSSGVLREVLNRLASEGLITSTPQRGFRVMDVSPEDLRQLTESRVLIETTLARESTEQGDLEFEARVTAAHHRLSRIPMTDGNGGAVPEWLEAHRQFHAELLSGSTNQRLRGIAAALRDAAEIYLCWSYSISGDVERDVADEHRHLASAAIEHQPDRFADLLKAHIERTTQALLAGHLKQNQEKE